MAVSWVHVGEAGGGQGSAQALRGQLWALWMLQVMIYSWKWSMGEGVELCKALSWSHLQQPNGAGFIPADLAHRAHGGDVAPPSAGMWVQQHPAWGRDRLWPFASVPPPVCPPEAPLSCSPLPSCPPGLSSCASRFPVKSSGWLNQAGSQLLKFAAVCSPVPSIPNTPPGLGKS